MDMKKFSMAAVAGGVTLFILGGLIYGIALGTFVEENSTVVTSSDPIMWAMVLSQIVMGGFIAYI